MQKQQVHGVPVLVLSLSLESGMIDVEQECIGLSHTVPAGATGPGCSGQLCVSGIRPLGADPAACGHDWGAVSHWRADSQDPCCAGAVHHVCRPAHHGETSR